MTDHEVSHWLQTAPAWVQESAPLPSYVDCAIIGAGVMGSALAYWLARAGREPLVLERNPAPAMGATGRNGGLMVQGSTRAYADDIRRIGREQARAIYDLTRENHALLRQVLAAEEIDAGFSEAPFISLVSDEAEAELVRESVAALREEGIAGEWLARDAIAKHLGTEPGLQFVGAAYRPGQGRVHSARYVQGVAAAAARHGARFAFSTPVQSVDVAPGGGGWLVRTARTTVPASEVVIALNAWSADLFTELDGLITPTRGHVVLTEPVDFQLASFSADGGFAYGRQLESGQLLFGGMRNVRPDMDMGHHPLPGQNVAPPLPQVQRALEAALPRFFPATEGVQVVQQWTGNMGYTPDEMPLVGGWPGRPGLWLLAGFSGHGMCYSQAAPKGLAAQMTGTAGPAIPAAFDPARYLSD